MYTQRPAARGWLIATTALTGTGGLALGLYLDSYWFLCAGTAGLLTLALASTEP